jgi:hypothetical protein
MRIGVIWESIPNAYYRALEPMRAVARRGHTVIWPGAEGILDRRKLATCDVLHVYRRSTEHDQRWLSGVIRGGMPIVYDNDDDLSATPKESRHYETMGALRGQRMFDASMKVARMARVVTTTNEVLAKRYRAAGAETVAVMPNMLGHQVHRPRIKHDGLVIGWMGGEEHIADLERIDVRSALERIVAKHRNVRIESIGADLELRVAYRQESYVEFDDLPKRLGGFDIGIAPLADLPLNQARSDIKLKEYAASGVVWLASPIGPYVGLGEEQGGRLVGDDEWFEALNRLVSSRRDRKRMARKGARWAREQTIESLGDGWEQLLLQAVG